MLPLKRFEIVERKFEDCRLINCSNTPASAGLRKLCGRTWRLFFDSRSWCLGTATVVKSGTNSRAALSGIAPILRDGAIHVPLGPVSPFGEIRSQGALSLAAERAPLSRSTLDIDLLGRTSTELENIRVLFAQLCEVEVAPNGIEFDSKSV
jgi:hypothetical protein